MTGDTVLRMLATLANPHRMRIVAALAGERNYVSRLARDLGISRALLQLHLRKLESARLVSATVEVSADGKAMKFYGIRQADGHGSTNTGKARQHASTARRAYRRAAPVPDAALVRRRHPPTGPRPDTVG